jgi:p-aminobenzoyl-glutamate transporter AbgT
VSAILATAGVEVTPPGTDETVAVKSMLTGEGLAMVFGTAPRSCGCRPAGSRSPSRSRA